MNRRHMARRDRSRLARRIFATYLGFSALALVVQYAWLDPKTSLWSQAAALDLLLRVCLGVALYVLAQRLVGEEEVTHEASVRATLDALQRLALASEFRDDMAAAHNNRIGIYSEMIAKRLNLGPEQLETLRYAATLHDLGKIAIPDSILQKPGPLTSDERDIVQKHVLYGADLLRDSNHPILQEAYNICLTHHENWDGSGYPNGLYGTDIPITGRIVGLADTFDALCSTRPYKRAWTVEEATLEVVRQAGRRFDPIVVTAFLHALPEIRAAELAADVPRSLRAPTEYAPSAPITIDDPVSWQPERVMLAMQECTKYLQVHEGRSVPNSKRAVAHPS
jgi:HD-GYP domain-containing protein (c-di-GMP phosphodiesterase class II)